MTFQAYLDAIEAKTGLTAPQFVELARERGLLDGPPKASDVLAWLAADYGLGRGHGMALFGIFKESLTPRGTVDDRLAKHFSGAKAHWQAGWDELWQTVRAFGPDVATSPTDTYITLLRGTRPFGVVATTAARLDVGVKLPGEDETARLEASGSWNQKVTHRVRVTDASQLDLELFGWLRRAYDAVG